MVCVDTSYNEKKFWCMTKRWQMLGVWVLSLAVVQLSPIGIQEARSAIVRHAVHEECRERQGELFRSARAYSGLRPTARLGCIAAMTEGGQIGAVALVETVRWEPSEKRALLWDVTSFDDESGTELCRCLSVLQGLTFGYTLSQRWRSAITFFMSE